MALALLAALAGDLAAESTQDTALAPPNRETLLEAAGSFARGKLLADEGDLEGALAAYDRAIALDASDPYALLEVAKFQVYMAQISRNDQRQLEHLQIAADYAGEARSLAPDNDDVLRHFAQVHLRLVEQNHFDSLGPATRAFEELRERLDSDIQVLTSLGQLYLWQRENARAAEVLREASSLRPGFTMLQLMLAEALIGSGELREAEGVLESLIALDPTSLEHRLRLAELRSQRGFHRGAVEVLQNVPDELLDNSRLRRLLARELHLVGDHEEALALADSLLSEFPDGEGLRRLRVAIFSSLARYEDAVDELRPLLEQREDPGQVLQDALLLSRLLERLGRADESIDRLQGVLAQDPESFEDPRQRRQAVMSLVGIAERQGDLELAREVLRAEMASEDSDAAVAFGRVLIGLLARNDAEREALEVLEQVRGRLPAEDPQHEALDLQHLALLEALEDWQAITVKAQALATSSSAEVRDAAVIAEAEALAAEDDLDRALQMVSTAETASETPNRRLQAVRLELLFRNDRGDEAVAELDALAASGELGDVFYAAQLFQQHQHFERSIPLFEDLVERVEDPRRPLFFLGAGLERSGRRADAIAAFEQLLERDPNYVPALNYLGYMWAERGEHLDQALVLIRRAVAQEPDNGAYVDSLGWVLFQMGRYNEARQHLEWAAKLVPDDPTILEHLGDLYVVLEDLDRARDSYRQALDLGGDPAELDQVRQKLEDLGEESPEIQDL